MRKSLALRALIVSTLIVLVFSIPLALLIRGQARTRALTFGRSDARSLAPILSLTGDPRVTGAVVSVAERARPREVSVVFPDGSVLGANQVIDKDPLADPASLKRARQGQAFEQRVAGGTVVYEPVLRTNASTAVVRVLVPNSQLQGGVWRAWLILALLGASLIGAAVVVSDRIGRTVVRSVGSLEGAAQGLERGDLSVRVEPSGPTEVRAVGAALNRMAERIEELIKLERATVADLSHRLRTPVTALRAEVAGVDDGDVKRRLDRALEELTRAIDQIIRDAQRPVRAGFGIVSDLGAVARQRAAFWAVLAEEQHRVFTVDVQQGPHPVAVVESDLAAVVDVLIDNVFSHTAEGVEFRLRVRTLGDEVELVVDDQGVGLPDGPSGPTGVGSTGLGLDIVRRTVESAGGTVALHDRAERGARVRATFARVG